MADLEPSPDELQSGRATGTAPAPARLRTRLSAQILICTLLAALLLCALVARYLRPLVLGDEIGVEPARVAQVEHRLDPNAADWPELANLPGVGEALAKRIVEYRRGRQKATGAAIVFRRPEELQAVRGIGPKKLEAMTPHLRFPAVKTP